MEGFAIEEDVAVSSSEGPADAPCVRHRCSRLRATAWCLGQESHHLRPRSAILLSTRAKRT